MKAKILIPKFRSLLFFLIIYCFKLPLTYAQTPRFFYTFESTTISGTSVNPEQGNTSPELNSSSSIPPIKLTGGNPPTVSTITGQVGKYLEFPSSSYTTVRSNGVDVLPSNSERKITVEFLAKFNDLTTTQSHVVLFSIGQAMIGELVLYEENTNASANPYIQFTSTLQNNTIDPFKIYLDEIGRKSIPYYFDKEWHHFVFVFDAGTSGFLTRQVWIDGQLPHGFDETISITGSDYLKYNSNTTWGHYILSLNNDNDYYCMIGGLDELAIYNDVLPCKRIQQHNIDRTIKHFTSNDASTCSTADNVFGEIDPMEFQSEHIAGGGNSSSQDISLRAAEQIGKFVLPHYKPGNSLPPIMNVIKARQMADDRPYNPSSYRFDDYVSINKELARNWGYYFNVTENTAADYSDYNSSSKYAGVAMDYLLNHLDESKNFKNSATSYWLQTDASLTDNTLPSSYHGDIMSYNGYSPARDYYLVDYTGYTISSPPPCPA